MLVYLHPEVLQKNEPGSYNMFLRVIETVAADWKTYPGIPFRLLLNKAL